MRLRGGAGLETGPDGPPPLAPESPMPSALLAPTLLLAPLAAAPGSADGFTERVSVSNSLAQGDDASGTGPGRAVAVSANGRVVAFLSVASNLVPGDTNGVRDAFVRDLDLDLTERISISTGGHQVDQAVTGLAVSGSGRWVAFSTAASNLVPEDQNGLEDIYLRDRVLGTTILVSRTPGGQAGNGTSQQPSISDDGRYVTFSSSSSNLVPGDTNGTWDVFLFDRVSLAVARVSVDDTGLQGNDLSHSGFISGNGRYIAYVTRATNLAGSGSTPFDDILVHDRQTGVTSRIGPGGLFGIWWNDHVRRPSLSNDGRYVAFESDADNVVPGDTNAASDVFVWDRQSLAVIPISFAPTSAVGNGPSLAPLISSDGGRVIFQSWASDLVPSDTNATPDVFVTQVQGGTVARVSVSTSGAQSNGHSAHPALSGNGARVAFTSSADTLVPGDTNLSYDVFARLMGTVPPLQFCPSGDNSLGCPVAIYAQGNPSATAGSGFTVGALTLVSNQTGILIYSLAGTQEVPFGQQFLCLRAPIRRTTAQGTGGAPGPATCTGMFGFDFNAWIAAGNDPALTLGTTVWSQIWSRDPGAPSGSHLTAGLTFVIGP